MADILRREIAPIPAEAWAEIDEQAAKILRGNLSARAIVDVDGPHGLALGAINLGGVVADQGQTLKGVNWGLRDVLPLVEMRVPFKLGVADLDNVARGGKTPDLGSVVQAAYKAALFEETAVYAGMSKAGIRGVLAATGNQAVPLPQDAGGYLKAVDNGIGALQSKGIGGPYALVLGTAPYQALSVGDEKGYPLRNRVVDLLGGAIHWSPALKGGALLSTRGGDFELTLGQDLSIGYAGHSGTDVELYVTESFTFRVLEPDAAVELKAKG